MAKAVKQKQFAVQPMAAVMALTGGKKNAAILMLDVRNYLPSSKKSIQGHRVLALTDVQLAERSGLSYSQVRRAKAYLVKQGLLKTVRKRDRVYHGGDAVTHISIPEEVTDLITDVILGLKRLASEGSDQNRIDRIVQKCTLPLYIEEVSKEKSNLTVQQDSQEEPDQLLELQQLLKTAEGGSHGQ